MGLRGFGANAGRDLGKYVEAEGGGALARWNTGKTVVAAAIVLALGALAWRAAPPADHPAGPGPWYSVLPPLFAVTAAIASGRILWSLVFAVIAGGLLSAVPDAPLSPVSWGKGVWNAFGFLWTSVSDPSNILILVFVTLVLALISTVIVAGGLHGIVLWLERFAKGRRSAQVVTYLMGLAVFMDDYANTMIVGASMRPVTDRYRISREKLSFIVDSTSAPVAGLAIISTWVGYEVGLFDEMSKQLGLGLTGYAMLFNALPFRFYCVMMLIFVGANAISGKDFGPMRKAERRAMEEGLVAAEDAVPMTSRAYANAGPDARARVRAAAGVIPIGAMFAVLLGSIWFAGGGWAILAENPLGVFRFTNWRDVISASDSIPLLAYSAGFGLLLAMVCARVLGKLPAAAIVPAAASGARSSLLPIVILSLAWSIKEACSTLGTGPFLVATLGDTLDPAMFPAMTFLIAVLTSFSTGTSYGTMAILMPTAVPIAFYLENETYGVITMITLAAILDGSIVGDHCSPISDTTIMSSISSSCDHMHHVRTQLPYSLSVAALAMILGYLPAGYGCPSWLSFAVAAGVIIAGFMLLKNGGTKAA